MINVEDASCMLPNLILMCQLMTSSHGSETNTVLPLDKEGKTRLDNAKECNVPGPLKMIEASSMHDTNHYDRLFCEGRQLCSL